MPADTVLPALRPRSREQLAHLLAEAAELEHNLLCCYLYAAFTLKRRGQRGLDDADAACVEAWRASIIAVAMEEMTHLALIANLTAAIGIRPHFNRPNLPVAPLYHPAEIVVELAPFDADTLDHFIFLERPEGTDWPDGASFAARRLDYRRGERPGASLMPSAVDYQTIGAFYTHLREVLSGLAADVGEAVLFCGPPSAQVGPGMVDLDGLRPIDGLAAALAALDTIVEQGEGAGAASEASHFSRFVAIRDEFLRLHAADPAFAPAWPAARNPLMRRPVDPASGVHVDAPAAAAVLDLGNAVYALTLRLLTLAWSGGADPGGVAQAGGVRPASALGAAMGLMGVLGSVGAHLCSLPASDAAPGVHAGLTFAMPRATEALVEAAGPTWIAERLGELTAGLVLIAASQPALRGLVGRMEGIAREFCEG